MSDIEYTRQELDLVSAAATILERQVLDLTAERDQWERHAGQYMDERDRAAADRVQLTIRIAMLESALRDISARAVIAQEKRDE